MTAMRPLMCGHLRRLLDPRQAGAWVPGTRDGAPENADQRKLSVLVTGIIPAHKMASRKRNFTFSENWVHRLKQVFMRLS
jgi:hypothetical protein